MDYKEKVIALLSSQELSKEQKEKLEDIFPELKGSKNNNIMDEKKIKAYKGFNSDMTCRGFQYEVGKTYALPQGEEVEVCCNGFHACENPFDVLEYYNDIDGKYCEVEQAGTIRSDTEKTASSKIKIEAEIGFVGLFQAGIEYLQEITKYHDNDCNDGDYAKIGSSRDYAKIGSSGDDAKIGSSGDYAQIGSSDNYAQIGSSGYRAQIGSSGYGAQIGSSGYYAQIGSSGNYAKIGSSRDGAQIGSSGNYAKIGSSGNYAQIGSSGYRAKIGSSGYGAQIGSSGDGAKISSEGQSAVVMCAGNDSCVRAKEGSWITLAEWKDGKLVCVKTEQVDGKRIKADTWYKIENGEFVEC